MHYEIFEPEVLKAEGDAVSITFSLSDGELCVMSGHAPAFAALAEGQLTVRDENGVYYFRTGAGGAEIKNDSISIFVSYCERTDNKVQVSYATDKKYKKRDKTAY